MTEKVTKYQSDKVSALLHYFGTLVLCNFGTYKNKQSKHQ